MPLFREGWFYSYDVPFQEDLYKLRLSEYFIDNLHPNALGAEISTEGLPAGIYIVRTTAPGFRMQKAIRVK